MKKQVFALYFANRGFFPETLIAGARKEMTDAVTKAGFEYIAMEPNETRNGAIETAEEGRKYAAWLKQHEGTYDGIILCLPNFGDENGAVPAMRDAGVPILIQAYPDEIGKMDFASRRDSYCGKFSMEDMFCQYNIPFSVYPLHVVHPLSDAFAQNLRDFAAVCRIVKSMRRFTIGGIGARTTAFKTVRFDELAMQKAGITMESYDLSELFARIRKMSDSRKEIAMKQEVLYQYCNFTKVPVDKMNVLSKMAVAIDDMIGEYQLDAVSIRCWNEMHQEFGIAPCVLLSELNDRGIAASCEMDICNAVAMRALSAASQLPAACLDWNNNYGDDPDRCILFHCGPVAQTLMDGKGTVGIHKMFAKGNGSDYGWGVNEGRIAATPMTYASMRTDNGQMYFYAGKGEFTGEPIEQEYFGCGGVVKIKNLQEKLIYIGKNGYRHHVTTTPGDYLVAIEDAFTTYLGYNLKILQ
ncbi:Hypothetical protein LUCI_0138 [Lucifera butyrica]|uniref:L-fucose isomerase C-terminal domain-containing protein n=1 Tax=Lucifera butyrica TaxID=1351585 RepID=A0A498R3T3_9FIRM|nr:hypothetical protein [Lucifera butyrica]VBB04932.1 Hypothetical protein LUCI_0138 [Lucifera butyrica]